MLVIPYNKESHSDYLKELLKSRSMQSGLIHDLPMNGLIALKGDQIVAAGYLRLIEGTYAMLDSYISSSTMPSELRHRALDLITNKLIKNARDMGISKLLAFSSDPNTYQRSLDHGFGAMDHKFSILNLR